MLTITPIPALRDNYIWLLTNSNNHLAAIIDPGDAKPVLKVLKDKQLTLAAILITHHHWDHTNGIGELKQQFGMPIYGPANDPVDPCDHLLHEGDHVTLPELDIDFAVLDIPGHTLGHIAFYDDENLFCGDTLFTAGCGRLFEGTAEQMFLSLSKLAALSDDTLVYCAHEYTADNLKFAVAVEPNNTDILQRIDKTKATRAKQLPTVPAKLSLEKLTNPFLRSHTKEVQHAASEYIGNNCDDPITTFAVIRRWKDNF